MSTDANWEGGVAPGDGDDLDFTLAPPLAEINANIPGVTFGKLWLDDGDIPTFTGSMTVSDCNDRAKVAGNTSVVFPAGNYTWRGTETNWGDADAWTFDNAAATWVDNNNAIFSTADAEATLAADVTANSLAFNANATIGGASTLTVPVVSAASGVSATISAPTDGALTKTGAGTLTLTQDRADATTLTAGTLKMDGASVAGLTLGTDGGPAVIFDYGGQTLSADPSTYLVTGSEVTLTNGVFSSSSTISIRDSAKIPTMLTIAKDASLVPDNGGLYILKDNGTATINVAGGTLGSSSGSDASYLQHASEIGRLNVNVTEGGRWIYPANVYALCNGTKGASPSLYMTFADSEFYVNGNFQFASYHATARPTSATGVFAATNSVITATSGFYIGYNAAENRAGAITAEFESCIVTARYFAVYCDRPLNNALFNGTTFVFGGASGTFNASDDAANWITVGEDGLTLDTQSYSCTVNANLGGSGAVTKVGAGTLTVASNQTATAALNVSAGALAVNGGVSVARPTTVASGATLTVNATDTVAINTLALEAGSTLNIASYDGTTPLAVATSATLPAEGTVNLTLNGGAFEEGVYAIYSKSGVTAADGEKFSFEIEDGVVGSQWSVEDDTLVLTVGYVNPNAWTGRGGDGRMSTGSNWGGGVVPAAGEDIDLSWISADTTLIADANRTFGTVTMGDGVITFTNSFAATSFSDTSKVAIAADSTVTVVGDLVFATNVTACVCYSIAEGGTFAVTGDIIATAEHTGYVVPCIGQDYIPGTISCKGIVNNCGGTGDRFYLVRGKSNTLANWRIGEDGVSGAKRFLIGNYSNSQANISARTNFTVSADIIQYRSLTLDTAGWTVSLGDGTSGGILGGAANGLTTVTGTGRVVINYDVNDLSSAASSRTNAFIVATGATLALNPSANIGFGDVTVQDGGTLEIQSGTTTFGNLTVEENAILAFNFTNRRNAPVLALYDGAEVTALDLFTVKVSGTVWPMGGEKQLTTCGGFDGLPPLTLSAVGDAARWAKPGSLSVNAGGNIVLDVRPMGTMILFR